MNKPQKEKLEGITVNGKPLYVFVEEQTNQEIADHHAQEVRESKLGTRPVTPASKYANISGQRSQYSNRIGALSPEILAHCNYLLEREGEKSVTDFLNTPKQEQSQNGSIEMALRDAQEKQKFYAQQEEKARTERIKWASVEQSLEQALGIITGKVNTDISKVQRAPMKPRLVDGRPLERLPRGFWPEVMARLMANGRVIQRQQLLEEMRAAAPGHPPDLAAAALTRAIAMNTLEQLPDNTVRMSA